MEGRRERKKRQTHEAIAETAVRLFAERGYDAVTVADVAAAADVAVTTVFNHFKTKEDLFFGSFTPPTHALAARLRERALGVGPVEVVRAFLMELLDQGAEPERTQRHEHHARVHAVLAASQSLMAEAAHRFRARRAETLDEVAAALTDAPDAFSYLLAGQLLALVDGTMCEAERQRRVGEDPATLEAALRLAVDRACDVLAKGLGEFDP